MTNKIGIFEISFEILSILGIVFWFLGFPWAVRDFWDSFSIWMFSFQFLGVLGIFVGRFLWIFFRFLGFSSCFGIFGIFLKFLAFMGFLPFLLEFYDYFDFLGKGIEFLFWIIATFQFSGISYRILYIFLNYFWISRILLRVLGNYEFSWDFWDLGDVIELCPKLRMILNALSEKHFQAA